MLDASSSVAFTAPSSIDNRIPSSNRLMRSPPSRANMMVQVFAPPQKPAAAAIANQKKNALQSRKQRAPPPVITFSSDEWNRGDAPAEPEVAAPEAQLLTHDAVDEYIPLEMRPPEWNGGPSSLLYAMLANGLPFLSVADIRGLAPVCKVLKRDMEDNEVWRLTCAALAKEHGLYAPSDSIHWRSLFFETLWPARNKWQGVEASEATGFRIKVAVRLRPRKHAANRDGLVLPLHQRLRLLKKGQKLGSLDEEAAGSSQEQLAEALKEQGDLSPELLQALLEAQQLDAVMDQAEAQARGGPKGGKSGVDVEDGSAAAHAAAAAADAVSEATPLTKADHEYLKSAEEKASAAEDAADKKKKEEEEKAKEEEDAAHAARNTNGSKLLLVQPSKVVMFIPGCGVRPFLFSSVCDEGVTQREVYQRVAQDAVVSALNGMNACVLAYGQTGSGKTHTVFGPSGAIEECAEQAERERPAARRGAVVDGLAPATTLPNARHRPARVRRAAHVRGRAGRVVRPHQDLGAVRADLRGDADGPALRRAGDAARGG